MLGLFRRHKPLFSDEELSLVLADTGIEDGRSGIRESYTFDIYLSGGRRAIGYISLRLGESPALYYLGHIGYRIHAPYRGHGYARRALMLLKPLLRREGLHHVVITTDVDNLPSRYTCLHAGCELERIAPVPPAYRAMCMGAEHKCRYLLYLPREEGGPL